MPFFLKKGISQRVAAAALVLLVAASAGAQQAAETAATPPPIYRYENLIHPESSSQISMYGWTPVHRKQVKKATLEAEKPDFLAAALERVNENRPVQ